MESHEPTVAVLNADEIIAFVDRIAASFRPRRIILFGSYACGIPTSESDVDLLITRRRWSMSPLPAAGHERLRSRRNGTRG
jgi:predicted nucleotidyltransferase